MEIQLPPRHQARLADLARQTGRDENEIVREMIGSYLDELDEVRGMLDRRLEAIESGRVKPLTPEKLHENLERRKQGYLRQRS